MIEKIFVFGGKGGVGKSSISAATAVLLSDLLPDKKILIISFDMAHNLSDLFLVEIGDKLTRLNNNLYGIEPDPNVYAEEYTKTFTKKMRKLLKQMPIVGLIPQIKDFIDTTFTADSIPLALKNAMFFQKILDAEDTTYRVPELEQNIDFDIVVADFPPTANMISLFDIPEDTVKVVLKYSLNFYNTIHHSLKAFSGVLRKMTHPFNIDNKQKMGVGDQLVQMLNEIEERGERISKLIHEKGTLRLVTIAEKPSFEEIKRARDLATKYVQLEGVHINMILPEKDDCNFCSLIRSKQLEYVKEIKKEFQSTKIWESYRLREEPIGLDGLRRLAKEIYGDSNVEKILYPQK